MIKESELLTYCDKGYLSLEARTRYLKHLNVVSIVNGEMCVKADANGVLRVMNSKGYLKPLYEVANEDIDRMLLRFSKQNKGNMGVDTQEVEKVVNKFDKTIEPNEIDF